MKTKFLLSLILCLAILQTQAQKKVWISEVSCKEITYVGRTGQTYYFLKGQEMANIFYRELAAQLKAAGYNVLIPLTDISGIASQQQVNQYNQKQAAQQQGMQQAAMQAAPQQQAAMQAALAKMDTTTPQGKANKARMMQVMASMNQSVPKAQQNMIASAKKDTLTVAKVQQAQDKKADENISFNLAMEEPGMAKFDYDMMIQKANVKNNNGTAASVAAVDYDSKTVNAAQTEHKKINPKDAADLKISINIKIAEVSEKKGKTTFALAGLMQIYDATGKQVQQFLLGQKFGGREGIKFDEDTEYKETVDGALTANTILTFMPAILTHLSKNFVDKITIK